MKFMFIVKSAHRMGPTLRSFWRRCKSLTRREIEAGRLLDNGGLTTYAEGALVRIADRSFACDRWPLRQKPKEVIGGYAVFELKDKEEAVASAVEFMQLHKDSSARVGGNVRGSRIRGRRALRRGCRLYEPL